MKWVNDELKGRTIDTDNLTYLWNIPMLQKSIISRRAIYTMINY